MLKQFGTDFIRYSSTKFHFASEGNCTPNKKSEYHQLLREVEGNEGSVEDLEIMGDMCGLEFFDQIRFPLAKAERVVMKQSEMTIDSTQTYNNRTICYYFPYARTFELSIGSINDRAFFDCEFHLLDDLTISGVILDESFDEILENFLIKNSRIQHLTFNVPTSRRVFQYVKKYLRKLRHVSISDKVLDDDAKNEIFIPGVRKLEINFKADSKCQTPVGVTFGGDELQELDIQCNQNDRNYEYFSTLYRYPNIKTLNAGFNLTDHDLLKMAGKFPLLTKANFTLVYHEKR